MYTYDIFIYDHNDLETYGKRGRLHPDVLFAITGEKKSKSRMTPHLYNSKEIILVIRLTAHCKVFKENLPPKVFLRIACADYLLSSAEFNVLYWLMKKLSNEEVAQKILRSVHTVGTHRKNIFRKLDEHDLGAVIAKVENRARQLMNAKESD
jgi:ATP/maltotriose-dependent transcriptional regulator MalT